MTTIKIYDEDAEALEQKAYELNTDVDEIVNELVKIYLDRID